MTKMIKCVDNNNGFVEKHVLPSSRDTVNVWQCHVVLYTRSSSAYKLLTHKQDFLQIVSSHTKISFRSRIGKVRNAGTHIPIRILWIIWKMAEKKTFSLLIKKQGKRNSNQQTVYYIKYKFNITWSANNKYKEC